MQVFLFIILGFDSVAVMSSFAIFTIGLCSEFYQIFNNMGKLSKNDRLHQENVGFATSDRIFEQDVEQNGC